MLVEFFVVVDANGDVGFGADQDEAETHYDENIGGSEVRRAIKLAIEVPFSVPVLKGTAPAEGEAQLVAVG